MKPNDLQPCMFICLHPIVQMMFGLVKFVGWYYDVLFFVSFPLRLPPLKIFCCQPGWEAPLREHANTFGEGFWSVVS